MNATRLYLGFGLVTVVSALVLSACDGRSTTAFQSTSYTPEELMAHQSQAAGTHAAPTVNGPKPVSAVISSSDVGGKPAPNAEASTPVDADPSRPSAHAYPDFVDRAKVVARIESLFAAADQSAKDGVLAVTFMVKATSPTQTQFSIDARVKIQGLEYNLADKAQGLVSALAPSTTNLTRIDLNLINDSGEAKSLGAFAVATCKDDACASLYVLIHLESHVDAVFELQNGQIVRHNVGPVGSTPKAVGAPSANAPATTVSKEQLAKARSDLMGAYGQLKQAFMGGTNKAEPVQPSTAAAPTVTKEQVAKARSDLMGAYGQLKAAYLKGSNRVPPPTPAPAATVSKEDVAKAKTSLLSAYESIKQSLFKPAANSPATPASHAPTTPANHAPMTPNADSDKISL